MKVIRSKEYYEQFFSIFNDEHRKLKYHSTQAENYKTLYAATEGRHGVWRLVHQWAYRMNRKHYDLGLKIGKEQMRNLLCELIALEKLQRGEEP